MDIGEVYLRGRENPFVYLVVSRVIDRREKAGPTFGVRAAAGGDNDADGVDGDG